MKAVEAYIKTFPASVQTELKKIRSLILTEVPDAEESINYGMPAYKYKGKPLVYFAGYKNHIGFYATPQGHAAFAKELSKYKQGKGSVQFPLDQTIPYDLIIQMVQFKKSVAGTAPNKKTTPKKEAKKVAPENKPTLAPSNYCEFSATLEKGHVHKVYHDTAYGFPIHNDDELFCRLVLEINQAGLSWTTILNKQENFRAAYHQFNVKKVAAYKEKDIARLMADAGIIRNRLKIEAAIYNANVILGLQKEHGTFENWLNLNHPKTKVEWMKLFKKTFKFTGGEIVNEFLMSTGYLPGAHQMNCLIYKKVVKAKPVFLKH
jgi:DNA-3-methyladenine glycosylase I